LRSVGQEEEVEKLVREKGFNSAQKRSSWEKEKKGMAILYIHFLPFNAKRLKNDVFHFQIWLQEKVL